MLRRTLGAVKQFGSRVGMFAKREGLGASELLSAQARVPIYLPFPSVKKGVYLQTHLASENSQDSGLPRRWEMLCLSREWSVRILSWQLEESLSVFHAISILRFEPETHIAVKVLFLLEVTLHKFSQNPWPPLLNIWGVHLAGTTPPLVCVCKAGQNKWENLSNWAFTPHIKHNTITYMPLDWTLSNMFLG